MREPPDAVTSQPLNSSRPIDPTQLSLATVVASNYVRQSSARCHPFASTSSVPLLRMLFRHLFPLLYSHSSGVSLPSPRFSFKPTYFSVIGESKHSYNLTVSPSCLGNDPSDPASMSEDIPANQITNGVATGRTIFDFANDVIGKLWEGPGKSSISFYQSGSTVRELKKKLGEWVHEAQDDEGRWQQPILTKAAFERHLITAKLDNAHMRPSGECTASFSWAKLLYALNIRPKQGKETGIISWRQAPDGDLNPAKTGTISLAIHGEVLCHIVNLYQTNTSTNSSSTRTFQLPFGVIKLQNEEKCSYTFSSLGDNELTSPRQPFPYSMRDRTRTREGHLISGTGNAITLYMRTLEDGISEAKLSFTAETEQTLPERVKILLEGMDAVKQREWDKPYLVAPSWIEQASRTKRRATTNAGKSDILMQHIIAFISKDEDVVKELKMHLPDEDTWNSLLASTVKQLFMFENDKYEFIWNIKMELSSRENHQFVAIVQDQLLRALQGLSETVEGQRWLRTTSEPVSAEDLLKVLNTPHRILNRPVIVLQHMPDEWNFLGEILD